MIRNKRIELSVFYLFIGILSAQGIPDWVTYSDIDDDLTMRGLTTVWNKRNLRHFLEYDNDFSNEDSSNGRCRLVSNRKMVGSVMNDSNG